MSSAAPTAKTGKKRRPRITPEQQKQFVRLRQQGWDRVNAARQIGASESLAIRFEKGHENSGDGYRLAKLEKEIDGARSFDDLSPEARRAVDDFEFFRRRYLGHVSTPW